MTSVNGMLKVMLDTNVLLGYYLGREPGCKAATELLSILYQRETVPYASSLSLKDLFYLLSMTLKRMARQGTGGPLSESDAAAARRIAWTCVRKTIGGCLQFAAAREVKVDYLVTSDENLVLHAPVACLAPKDALKILEEEDATF